MKSTKKSYVKFIRCRIFFWVVLFLLSLLCINIASGAEYHVATFGNDISGTGSLDQPWKTPQYGASRLSDGDKLLIHAGTYAISTSATPIKSAAIAPSANNTTIAAFPGDIVILSGNGGVAPTNGVIGNTNGNTGSYKSNVTIDGFIIQGVVVMEYGTGIVVQNCDISVGGDSWSGIAQGELIWFEGCDNCTIKNNKLHDNSARSNATNNSLIMAYTGYNLLIENNEFYNSVGAGINIKDTTVNTTIRYNFIHDNTYSGIWTANQGNPYKTYTHPQDMYIYQNIIINNNKINSDEHGGITFSTQTTNIDIYNNSFYNNNKGDFTKWTSSLMPAKFFNNISYNPANFFLNWPYAASTMTFTFLDYNSYYTTTTPQWRLPNSAHTSVQIFSPFSTWQTNLQTLLPNNETNSIYDDPGFINASGKFNSPTDFKRSAYKSNGRGGDYPSVMGAYITGTEAIGLRSPISLSSPKNLILVK